MPHANHSKVLEPPEQDKWGPNSGTGHRRRECAAREIVDLLLAGVDRRLCRSHCGFARREKVPRELQLYLGHPGLDAQPQSLCGVGPGLDAQVYYFSLSPVGLAH
jgi:hypothetical protein